jgi:cation transport regulator
MPYDSNEDLPQDVQDALPDHAEEIYREAFNSAWEQYEDPEEREGDRSREETAHAVAWSAVKAEYKQNEEGEWVKEEGED